MDFLSPSQITELSPDELDAVLNRLSVLSSQITAAQVRVLREVDRRQVPLGDGMRTLSDWIVARMDVTPATARKLSTVTRVDDWRLDELLDDGVSFERVAELAVHDLSDPHLELDMVGLRTELARRTRREQSDDRSDFETRFLAIQPSLDESAWNLWGKLPALEGKVVADTIDRVADKFPKSPFEHSESRATRRADALFQICDRTDTSTDGNSHSGSGGVNTTVFVDATDASRPDAWIASGPRVGPGALERLLCESAIDVISITDTGVPLTVGNATTAIPPKTRRFVLFRDGGICTADGCGSTYRLQPHHITPRSDGGDHHQDNLASLCWFHHHVVVHGRGFRVDPKSPARRRRFLPPEQNSDPPI